MPIRYDGLALFLSRVAEKFFLSHGFVLLGQQHNGANKRRRSL